jgi:PAS domain S-box-containing protein
MIGPGAFDAIEILSALLAIGAAVLLVLVLQYVRLLRESAKLEADIGLAETTADIGYWSRKIGTPNTRWSDGMFRIFGQDQGTFVPSPETIMPQVHPDDVAALMHLLDPVATGGAGGNAEARITTPAGTVKHLVLAIRYRFEADKAAEYFGVAVDVTARKQAEAATVAREEQLQRALTAMGAAVWEIHVASGAMTASGRWAEILGHDPGRFVINADIHRALLHPDDAPRVLEAFRVHLSSPTPLDIEYRMQRRQGGYAWVHVRGRLQDDRRKMIGTAVDVTERRTSGERLQKQAREATLLQEGVRLTAAATSLSDALRAIIDMVCATIGWPVGHAFVTDEEHLELRPLDIWRDSDAERYQRLSQLNRSIRFAPGVGLPGEVWLTERPVWVSNMRTSPLFAHLKDMQGLGAAVAFPIRVRGETVAVVEFLSDRVQREDEDLLRVFESLGLQIGSVIERQNADEELRRSRESLALALQVTQVGYFELTPVGTGFWSPRAREICGIKDPEFELTREKFIRMIVADDLPEFLADLEEVEMRHTALDHELRIRTPSGDVVWVHFQSVRQLDRDGKHVRTIGFLRDISQRKSTERSVVESERKYRSLIESSMIGLMIQRRNKAVFCNLAHARQLGYDRIEDVLALKDLDVHRLPEDKGKSEQQWQLFLSGEASGKVRQFAMIDRFGRKRWWEVIGQLIDWDGEAAWQSMIVDVTDRVEREAELGAARDRLKNQADELAELAQNLEAERARAEEANAAKSRFLAMMSHELRTPLTGILGLSDLLKASGLNVEQQELQLLLTRSARALLDLLNDILDFSKVEAGHLEIERVPFRLNEVINDVVNLFATVASEKGIVLETELPGTFWNALVGDPKRLRQVLTNLIGNAVKFTQKGQIVLSLAQERIDDGGLWLRFAVTDSGIGISPQAAERLFKPFVQADSSTSRMYGGTGLGLAICKRLVTAMGGEISVDSTPGKGSRFSFFVRVGHAQLGQLAQPASPAEAPTKLPPLRILVAEDNETSRRIVHAMLARQGHTIETVNNGAEALSAVIANAYDVVLMDMQMPVMDGADATRAIRALDGDRRRVPVIALTADVVAANRGGYFAAGVDDIVAKPIDWQELTRAIAKRLGMGKRGLAEEPAPATPAPPPRVETPEPVVEAPKPTAAAANALVLDETMLKSLVDALGEEIFAPMVITFRANMIQYRDELSAAVAAGDLKKAKRTAHALKGLCAQFGAPHASRLAKIIEVDSQSLADIAPMLSDVADAVQATERALAVRFPGHV